MNTPNTNPLHALIDFVLHLADTNLILTQRNGYWCGHGPILEQDIAITNITLDIIGQARNFYQYAAKLINENDATGAATEDTLAYHRTEREFKNLLLAEQPNGDWAQTILRQFFYAHYQFLIYTAMQKGKDEQLAAIAAKSIKETTYHITWCNEWVIRLGDGTAESKLRMETALENLWPYTGEMFVPAPYETSLAGQGIITDPAEFKETWLQKVQDVLDEATLAMPAKSFAQSGGKTGVHTEELGYLLSEMQYLQRVYPGAEW